MQLTEKKGDRVCNCITFWGGGEGKAVRLSAHKSPAAVSSLVQTREKWVPAAQWGGDKKRSTNVLP